MTSIVTRVCRNFAVALPGARGAAGDIPSFLQGKVSCRICRLFNAMDRLGVDCDQLDNGTTDASC